MAFSGVIDAGRRDRSRQGSMGAGEIVAVLVVAFSATGIPVFAHLGGQAFGVASCFVIAALIANYAVAAVPTTLIVSFLFQNLFVSLVSPLVGSVEEFDAARAYNFFLTATIWLVLMAHYVSHWTSFEPSIRRWINFGFVALALVFAYFCLGVPANAKGAAVYLRNVATPFLLFQICVLVGVRVGLATARPLIVVGYLALIYGYSELFFRESLLSVTNSDTYFELRTRESSDTGQWVKLMQETGRVVRDFEDTQRIKLLNTPLLDVDLEFDRLMGPNLHSISFAYALCFFSLLFLARGRVLFLLAALPLLVIIGSKGALIMLVVTAAFVGISRFVAPGPLFWAMIALLCSYAVATIVVGSRIGDYHVIGLMGGLEGFAANPLGRGLGAGGNLSLNMAAMNWNLSQALGKTDTAVESAIGVLLYQMGVAGLALCAGTVWIARRAWRQFLATRRLDAAVVAFALLAITANGLFQEEALFAPLALGTLMALAGLVLSQERAALRRRRPVRADPPLVFEKAS